MIFDVMDTATRWERAEDARPKLCVLPGAVTHPEGRRYVVLVLDDDPVLRDFMVMVMRRAGYLVESRANGEEGWEAMQDSQVDLLITDNDMPRLKGLDLLRRMRARRVDVPAILVSGLLPLEAPDLERVLQPGKTMCKPYLLTELLENVRMLLV